jgi:hypothetical protein
MGRCMRSRWLRLETLVVDVAAHETRGLGLQALRPGEPLAAEWWRRATLVVLGAWAGRAPPLQTLSQFGSSHGPDWLIYS